MKTGGEYRIKILKKKRRERNKVGDCGWKTLFALLARANLSRKKCFAGNAGFFYLSFSPFVHLPSELFFPWNFSFSRDQAPFRNLLSLSLSPPPSYPHFSYILVRKRRGNSCLTWLRAKVNASGFTCSSNNAHLYFRVILLPALNGVVRNSFFIFSRSCTVYSYVYTDTVLSEFQGNPTRFETISNSATALSLSRREIVTSLVLHISPFVM